MLKLQRITAAVLLTSLFCGQFALAEEHGTRVVGPHETISQISFNELEGSVYHSKRGTLLKIMALNPWLKNINKVKPGDVLVMPRSYSVAKVKPTSSPARELASAKEEVEEAVARAKPAAPAAPAEECEGDKEDCFTPVSHLGVNLGTDYYRIDATDLKTKGQATILSRMSPAVRAYWKLDWSPEWSSILALRYRSDKVSPTDNNSKRIDQGDGSTWGFGAGVERRWNKNARSRLNLGRQEYLNTRALSTSLLVLDRVGTTYAGLEHEQTIVRVKSASAGVGAAGNYLFAASGPGYDTKSGWNGRGSAFVQHERDSFSLRGSLFYEMQRQNSSIAEQKTTTTGLEIGAFWRLP